MALEVGDRVVRVRTGKGGVVKRIVTTSNSLHSWEVGYIVEWDHGGTSFVSRIPHVSQRNARNVADDVVRVPPR